MNNSPAENAEDKIEHEERSDHDNRDKVKPVERSAHSVVRLTNANTTALSFILSG